MPRQISYSGPEGFDTLLQLLGMVLYRTGGYQEFTAKEIDDINAFVGRVQVLSRIDPATLEDKIIIRLTSKEGAPYENPETKPS